MSIYRQMKTNIIVSCTQEDMCPICWKYPFKSIPIHVGKVHKNWEKVNEKKE